MTIDTPGRRAGPIARAAARQHRQLGAIVGEVREEHQRPAAHVVHRRAEDEEPQPCGICPPVEHEIRAHQRERQPPERQRVVQQQDERQEVENKEMAAEDHGDRNLGRSFGVLAPQNSGEKGCSIRQNIRFPA